MVSKNIAVVILAAGKGTRMKSEMPKVMHKIAGYPMIKYVLANVSVLSPKSITVVVGPDMKPVEEAVRAWDKRIKCVVQKNRRGTGDAVKHAKNLVGFKGAVLVLYADTPFITPETMQFMIEQIYREQNNALVVLGFSPEDSAEYGRILLDEKGRLAEIVEYKDANEEQRKIELCNAGVMAIRGELLFDLLGKLKPNNAKKEYYLTDLVSIARDHGYYSQVVEVGEDEVMGINSRDQLAYAESLVQNSLRWDAMSGGATLIAPETVFLSHDTQIGQDVIIHPNVVIGSGVVIENNVEIKSFSHLEGVHIKSGASIGPFARIRPGTIIGEDSKIGNFVEIKNSDLSEGTKIGHLSYIGDTKIGKNANIGAGTVTCNYDGKNKFRTEIGDSAFIGSNTSLVAPVKIGKNALVGAGSTVTKDVKPNSRVINHMPQIELQKGKKNKKS